MFTPANRSVARYRSIFSRASSNSFFVLSSSFRMFDELPHPPFTVETISLTMFK
jgi:hypothetical protein